MYLFKFGYHSHIRRLCCIKNILRGLVAIVAFAVTSTEVQIRIAEVGWN